MNDSKTIGAVAAHFGCKPWQVRRLYERGILPPAPRVGAYRVVLVEDLPKVEAALRASGYLPHDANSHEPHHEGTPPEVPHGA